MKALTLHQPFASLDEYPMATHWAAQIDDSGAGDE